MINTDLGIVAAVFSFPLGIYLEYLVSFAVILKQQTKKTHYIQVMSLKNNNYFLSVSNFKSFSMGLAGLEPATKRIELNIRRLCSLPEFVFRIASIMLFILPKKSRDFFRFFLDLWNVSSCLE